MKFMITSRRAGKTYTTIQAMILAREAFIEQPVVVVPNRMMRRNLLRMAYDLDPSFNKEWWQRVIVEASQMPVIMRGRERSLVVVEDLDMLLADLLGLYPPHELQAVTATGELWSPGTNLMQRSKALLEPRKELEE